MFNQDSFGKRFSHSLALCCLSACLLVSQPTLAKVYKKVLPDGTVVFSDAPTEGSEEIEVKPLPSINLPPIKPFTPSPKSTPGVAPEVYKSFSISSPSHDETINHGAGNFSVSLKVSPELIPKHKIQVLLDGQPIGPAASTTVFNLTHVDRGTHTISARIISQRGKTVKTTPTITIHMRRPIAR